MIHLTLFGTDGCHLCDEAEQRIDSVLGELGLAAKLHSIDIAEDDALLTRYGIRIPVLSHAGTNRELGWPFGGAELEKFIASVTEDAS
ncbi:MAG: glutaredoxin family protein [Methylococcus sp.]|nr:MAG: glutaredoxin family protein [Methylococcus sp.]